MQDAANLDNVVSEIAGEHGRLDGLVAAAGVQNVTPALDYPPHKISEVSTVANRYLFSIVLMNYRC